jgi:hypothetical protein
MYFYKEGYGGLPLARKDKEVKLRALNAVCSSLLVGAIIYALIASFDLIAISIISASLVGAAIPVVLSGEGILEIIIGVFEAIFEGIVELFAGIVEVISSIFS